MAKPSGLFSGIGARMHAAVGQRCALGLSGEDPDRQGVNHIRRKRKMEKKIEVVSLGPALEDMQYGAVQALLSARHVVLQSRRPGACAQIAERCSGTLLDLDDLFASATDFDSLYASGAQRILSLPEDTIVFGCIGDPGDNGFVQALAGKCQLEFRGGYDQVADALQHVPKKMPYSVVDARSLKKTFIDSSKMLVVVGIDDRFTAADAKLVLSEYYPPSQQGLLVLDGRAVRTDLYAIDRNENWGSGAVLVLEPPALLEKERYTFVDLLHIMEALRAPGGCPWDAEQTHETLRPCLIEESYEVADAVSAGDLRALYDELGDVLLQVVFHAQIGEEAGEFDMMDVTTAVCSKMIRRHPHVFGSIHVRDSAEVLQNWDAIKLEEKGEKTYTSAMEDIPAGMSALLRAVKIQKKAANVGFEWPVSSGAVRKVREETDEFEAEIGHGSKALEQEGGDLLFAAVNALRMEKVDPETALSAACSKFIRRFRFIEEHASTDLRDMTLDEMDALWNEAKESEQEDAVSKEP